MEEDQGATDEEAAVQRPATPPPEVHKSPGDRSFHSISGTTARSDYHSDDDDDDDDDEPIVRVDRVLALGAEVYDAAYKLLSIFKYHEPELKQVLLGIGNSRSPLNKQFQLCVQNFNSLLGRLRHEQNDNETSFLDPERVMRSLFGPRPLPSRNTTPWRLIEIVQLLNLASLAHWIVEAEAESESTWRTLHRLDEIFPQPFVGRCDGPVPGNSDLLDETFKIALDLRLQASAMAIQHHYSERDYDAKKEIHKIFYALPNSTETLKGWNVNGLGSGILGLLPDYDRQIHEKIRSIMQCLHDDTQAFDNGDAAEMRTLHQSFPWANFRITVLQWITLRTQEITMAINKNGNVDDVMTALKAKLGGDTNVPEVSASKLNVPKKKRRARRK